MNIAKKYQNNAIPKNNANQRKSLKPDVILNPYIGADAKHNPTLYPWYLPWGHRYTSSTITMYTTQLLVETGKHHTPFNLYEYMGQYGGFLVKQTYKANYTSIVKYVAWSLDLHNGKKYNLPKPKRKRKK